MVLLGVVYLSMNRNKSYGSVTPRLMEDTMRETKLHTRYYNLVFIGQLFSRMLVSLSYLVMNVKELVILVDVRKCLCIIHLLLNHLMFGALIIWDLFLPLMGIHIFWLLLIMLLSGWKLFQLVVLIITPPLKCLRKLFP